MHPDSFLWHQNRPATDVRSDEASVMIREKLVWNVTGHEGASLAVNRCDVSTRPTFGNSDVCEETNHKEPRQSHGIKGTKLD